MEAINLLQQIKEHLNVIKKLDNELWDKLSEYEMSLSIYDGKHSYEYYKKINENITQFKKLNDKMNYDSSYDKFIEHIIENTEESMEEIKQKANTKPLLFTWYDSENDSVMYRKSKRYRIDENDYDEKLHCYKIYDNGELIETEAVKTKFGSIDFHIKINGTNLPVKRIIAQHFDIPNDDRANKTWIYYKNKRNDNRKENLFWDIPERWKFKK